MKDNADHDQESRRLATLLYDLLRLTHRSVRSVEQELGVGSSGLGKVLNGTIRLSVGHILMVTAVLGMTPGQFFQLAYPNKEPLHPLSEELRRVQGLPKLAGEQGSPELEVLIRRTILRMMGELVRQEEGVAAR